jgi:hypothetical protein
MPKKWHDHAPILAFAHRHSPKDRKSQLPNVNILAVLTTHSVAALNEEDVLQLPLK